MPRDQKEKEKPEAPAVCVCGNHPATVKHKSRYMVCCPAAMTCAIRGEWKGTEQQAIKSWNVAVQSARRKRPTHTK